MLHVNPTLDRKGMLVVYNPLPEAVERRLLVPLYYTGLTDTARVTSASGEMTSLDLDREYRVTLPVVIPARAFSWYLIE
jgi:hypothetical protein